MVPILLFFASWRHLAVPVSPDHPPPLPAELGRVSHGFGLYNQGTVGLSCVCRRRIRGQPSPRPDPRRDPQSEGHISTPPESLKLPFCFIKGHCSLLE